MRKRGIIITIVSCALVLIAGVLGGALFFRPVAESIRATEFDPQKWRAGSHLERGRMARDLESSGRLRNLTREQVTELLGLGDYPSSTSLSYTVDIGHDFGSSPWLYVLEVRFDKNGKVEAAVVHD